MSVALTRGYLQSLLWLRRRVRNQFHVILFTLPQDSPLISGRISDILVNPDKGILVILELFQILSSRDEVYGMPVLVRRDSEVTYSIVPAKVGNNVLFYY
jgi:hypothetical protein